MRIEYDATLDDIAETHLRLEARSKVARTWRWEGIVISGLLAGVILFMLIPEPLLTGVGGAVLYAITYKRMLRRRLRKYLREQLGTEGPVKFQVELTEAGIWTKQKNTQITFEWANVASLEETSDSVDFIMRDGGIVVVRNKGFQSSDTRRQFLECGRKHIEDARKLTSAKPSS